MGQVLLIWIVSTIAVHNSEMCRRLRFAIYVFDPGYDNMASVVLIQASFDLHHHEGKAAGRRQPANHATEWTFSARPSCHHTIYRPPTDMHWERHPLPILSSPMTIRDTHRTIQQDGHTVTTGIGKCVATRK